MAAPQKEEATLAAPQEGVPDSVLQDARAFFRAGGVLSREDWKAMSPAEKMAHAAAKDEMRAQEAYVHARILRDALFPPPSLEDVMREGGKVALNEGKALSR